MNEIEIYPNAKERKLLKLLKAQRTITTPYKIHAAIPADILNKYAVILECILIIEPKINNEWANILAHYFASAPFDILLSSIKDLTNLNLYLKHDI